MYVNIGDLVTMGLSEMVLSAGIGWPYTTVPFLLCLEDGIRTQACADRFVKLTALRVASRGGASKAFVGSVFIFRDHSSLPNPKYSAGRWLSRRKPSSPPLTYAVPDGLYLT